MNQDQFSYKQTMPKYIIQIAQQDNYPFEGVKIYGQPIIVRKSIPIITKEEEKIVTANVQRLLSVSCQGLVQVVRVLERRGKEIVIDYEYVPECLGKSQKLGENHFVSTVKEKLLQLCQNLARAGIKINIRMEDIGLTSQGELKLFVGHRLQLVQQGHSSLSQDYQIQIDRIIQQHSGVRHSAKAPSELSDYSVRLDKKISRIEDRLNRRKRRRSKGASSLQRQNSSEKDKRVALISPTDGVQKKSSDSQTSQRTRYSTIQMTQLCQPKTHRASFNDFQTTSYQLNQSSRDDSLKKRFDKALQKTQNAFKIYDKYAKRGRHL